MNEKYFLPVSVLVAGVLIAGAVIWTNQHPGPVAQQGAPTAPKVNVKDVDINGAPYIGNPQAPITIVEWADYQCPFCKRFEEQTLPTLITKYVDTGKVKIVFKHFAFLGEDSTTAAHYDQAIWALYPEKYLTWRNAMYAKQDDEGDQGFGDAESIDALNATISGIDADKVRALVAQNKDKYQKFMDAEKAEGQKFGISATPSFIVGTEMIAGAYPIEKFTSVIEGLLAKK